MLATCPHCHNAVDVGDGSAVMLCEYCGREFHPAATPVIAGTPAEPPPPPQYRLRITPEERAVHLGRHPAAATPRRAPARHHPLATLGWALGILVLAAALAVQYAYFMREDLARHVALRPWLERLCSYAHCQIPLLRDPASIRIVARDIRRHPSAEGALRVMLTLENDSPYVQAYPAIQLSFLDFRGKLLARRRFTPQEYLSVTLDPSRGMPVRQPVQSVIDIVDPGPEAVNFEFLLR
jgi:hypothetical protein